jgi:predicted amidohydrolase YtcJ
MVGYNFATGLPPPDLQALIERAAADNMRLVGLSTELFDSYREIQPGQLQPGHGWLIQHRSLFTRPQQRLSEDLGIGTTFLPVEAIYKQGALSAQPENAADWMPLARVLDAGLPVSIATDNIPVSLFFAIWCCLARTDYQGRSFPSDEGTISRLQAMEIATIAAARCLGRQDRIGSLSVGKLADLAVLNDDYLHCDLAAIADIRSVATMVGGRWRHDRLGLQVQADGRAPRQATLSKSSPIMGHGTPIALPGC